jgi:signal transduction histidine kinase
MISFIVLAISSYLSSRITNPITEVAQLINEYDFEGRQQPVQTKGGGIEIQILTKRFNELMDKMQEAFAYQKHVVHHISHELKTPIAVLVSNFERMEKEPDPEKVRQLIGEQKEDTKKLSEIIHALLEIAKLETKSGLTIAPVRCDELIFDIVDELQLLYPDFTFTIDYLKLVDDEQQLTVWVNERLIRLALTNVLVNAIQYSHGSHASVLLGEEQGQLLIKIMNQGAVIQERERQFIFQHFFRGENSKGKRGFGLGLVLVNKILELHHGSIAYVSHYGQHNEFNITLPGMVFAQGMVPNTHSNST